MDVDAICTSTPTRYKENLTQHKIPIAGVVRHIKRSYAYIVNIAKGVAHMTPEILSRLDELVAELEGRA